MGKCLSKQAEGAGNKKDNAPYTPSKDVVKSDSQPKDTKQVKDTIKAGENDIEPGIKADLATEAKTSPREKTDLPTEKTPEQQKVNGTSVIQPVHVTVTESKPSGPKPGETEPVEEKVQPTAATTVNSGPLSKQDLLKKFNISESDSGVLSDQSFSSSSRVISSSSSTRTVLKSGSRPVPDDAVFSSEPVVSFTSSAVSHSTVKKTTTVQQGDDDPTVTSHQKEVDTETLASSSADTVSSRLTTVTDEVKAPGEAVDVTVKTSKEVSSEPLKDEDVDLQFPRRDTREYSPISIGDLIEEARGSREYSPISLSNLTGGSVQSSSRPSPDKEDMDSELPTTMNKTVVSSSTYHDEKRVAADGKVSESSYSTHEHAEYDADPEFPPDFMEIQKETESLASSLNDSASLPSTAKTSSSATERIVPVKIGVDHA